MFSQTYQTCYPHVIIVDSKMPKLSTCVDNSKEVSIYQLFEMFFMVENHVKKEWSY